LGAGGPDDVAKGLDGRCESIGAFVIQLQRLFEGKGKIILIFDGIDHQREALPTLIPAVARLGEVVRIFLVGLIES
jgi:origin recognition complex subunit 5